MARWLLDKLDQVERLGGWVGHLQVKHVPGDEIDLTAHSYGLTRAPYKVGGGAEGFLANSLFLMMIIPYLCSQTPRGYGDDAPHS